MPAQNKSNKPILRLKWVGPDLTCRGYKFKVGKWAAPISHPQSCVTGYHVISKTTLDAVQTWCQRRPELWVVECRGANHADYWDDTKEAWESIRLIEKVGDRPLSFWHDHIPGSYSDEAKALVSAGREAIRRLSRTLPGDAAFLHDFRHIQAWLDGQPVSTRTLRSALEATLDTLEDT